MLNRLDIENFNFDKVNDFWSFFEEVYLEFISLKHENEFLDTDIAQEIFFLKLDRIINSGRLKFYEIIEKSHLQQEFLESQKTSKIMETLFQIFLKEKFKKYFDLFQRKGITND